MDGLTQHQELAGKRPHLQINYSRNYQPDIPEYQHELYSNLLNTEIDIVIETPNFLLIGEAKIHEKLDANSDNFLAHQLIRQWVMATILAKIRENPIKIIPFIVCDEPEKIAATAQVEVMGILGGLKRDNIFHWDDMKNLE